ncbi:hook-length control protein FliK [Pseudobutyrivibrio sp. YE44]|uniref:flagellar hook-length control protein FliK n=1 Tax=Pseudobutyrivibrio sp. YE44 TaxID=1520802 RepID=UPI00088328A7|nr:flagellar hook-length control protein FliK [Pseudobutyrivibrio sp. YE44]SDB10370.1 hook-length control protein FliK [Pseudobutyrivibrio sp. YE44]
MNINTGFNPYNGGMINDAAARTKMAASQSLTGTAADTLKEGEVFEGSVNSIENGKVTIGLANGQTMTARLDSGVNLVPGQSVFFEVKSNDGNLIQIRPVNLGGLEANPTLLKALDLANISVSEKNISMVNSMMQNSMPINPENLAAMHRIVLNNPEVDPQTLVTMAKHGLDITPDNISMFTNYANDKAVLSDNFQVIADMLPELMTSEELTASDVININSQLKAIFVEGSVVNLESQVTEQTSEGNVTLTEENVEAEATTNQQPKVEVVPTENFSTKADGIELNNKGFEGISNNINPQNKIGANAEALQVNPEASKAAEGQAAQTTAQQIVTTEESGIQMLNNFAGEKQINSFNAILNNLPDFPKDNLEIFGEDGTLKTDANIKEVFREISDYLENHPDIPKSTLNDIIKAPLYRGLLKNLITDSFTMEPKDVTKPGEISKLYERVLKQTEALERLISSFNNKASDAIKNQTNEIKQNINFMNSANEMYNFVQIPLKMYNQNTDSMLYVRQNKKSSYEAGEEITAFLHFDMEYLGPTDVFISLKETKVGCKWNLANESSLKLIEDNLDLLTERLEAKGFTVSSELTCGEDKADFVEDFLGSPPIEGKGLNEGLVHRYSFDMRA